MLERVLLVTSLGEEAALAPERPGGPVVVAGWPSTMVQVRSPQSAPQSASTPPVASRCRRALCTSHLSTCPSSVLALRQAAVARGGGSQSLAGSGGGGKDGAHDGRIRAASRSASASVRGWGVACGPRSGHPALLRDDFIRSIARYSKNHPIADAWGSAGVALRLSYYRGLVKVSTRGLERLAHRACVRLLLQDYARVSRTLHNKSPAAGAWRADRACDDRHRWRRRIVRSPVG